MSVYLGTVQILLLAFIFPILASCTGDMQNETTDSGIEVCPIDMIIPEVADKSFADSLMLLTKEDGNRMLSPYSAKMCLALLANGARGETREQILSAIGINDLDEYNQEVKSLLTRYESYSAAMSLNTANSLWLNQSAFEGKGSFITAYRTKMQDLYSAEVREVTDKNSIEEVNAWAYKKTNGKISEILSEEHRHFAAVLANAVYFKAAWKNAFNEHQTEKGDFTNTDGSTSIIDFMHSTESYGYFESDEIKAVRLDYSRFGEDEKYVDDTDYNFSMYFMLSENDLDIEAFLSEASFNNEKVCVTIPKFKLEYKTSLTEILKSLGMTLAFEDDADLGAMLNEAAKVDDVLQKTYIKIDEKGTEAAAVTAITVRLTSAVIDERPIKEFTADRPFYFAIKDNTNGELLFIGRYESAK